MLALTTLVTAAPLDAQAQSCPSDKVCFYIPPALPTPPGYTVDWDLSLAASNGTVEGTYQIGTAAAVNFSTDTSTPVNVPLSTTEGVANGYSTAERRGIFIQANSDALNVTRRLSVGPWQSSSSVKDSARALGTRFRLAGYSLSGTNTADTGFDHVGIYAPRGGTVSIKAPPGAALPFWEGEASDTVTVTLSAGQTYIQRTRVTSGSACDQDITGALLTSTDAVSVTTGGRGWGRATTSVGACLNTGGCGDEGEDNTVPTSGIGTEYVVSNYNTNNARSTVIVADEAGTTVSLNGSLVATLAAGERHYFRPTGVTFIETSRPAYVYQNAGTSGCEMGLGFVPPVSFASAIVNTVAFNVLGSGQIRMLIETDKIPTVTYDGAALPGSTTTIAVPGKPEWSVLAFASAAGDHLVDAGGDYQLGLATGGSGTGLYAYYNIFNLANCGDNNIDANEGCDDGNTTPGDGCNSVCKIEVTVTGCVSDLDCAAGLTCDATGTCIECASDSDCNDGNSCTTDTCVNNACEATPEALGATCPSGVCDGDASSPSCVSCIDDAPGLDQDTGCPASAPACVDDGLGGLTCGGCVADIDCDDGNSCTADTCSAGTCGNDSVAQGTVCGGGAGVCNGDVAAPSCDACVPNSGSSPDTGCVAAQPYCDGSGAAPECVECVLTNQCGAGEFCNDDSCDLAAVDIQTPADGGRVTTPTALSGTATDGASVRVQLVDDAMNVILDVTVTAFGGTWSVTTPALTNGATYMTSATITTSDGEVQDIHTFDAAGDLGEPCALNGECLSDLCQNSVCACNEDLDCPAGNVCDTTEATNTCEPVDTCGNGSIETNEECDDGNTASGDGCDVACVVEPLYTCVGEPSICDDVTAPIVTIDAPSDGAAIATASPVLSGTSEAGSTVTVTVTDALGAMQTLMTTTDASGDWSIDLDALNITLPEGPTALSAQAIDAAANSSATVTSAFTVDVTVPTIAIDAPADGDTLATTTPTVSGTTEPNATVTVVIDEGQATEQTLNTTADASGDWTVTPTALAQGTHTLNARAVDAAGNATPADATASFTVDTVDPTLAVTDPADGATTGDDTPTIIGTTEPNAAVTVVIDAGTATEQTLTTTADNAGAWSVTSATLGEGPHTLTADAQDAAGNAAPQVTSSFDVDLTGPGLTLDSPVDGARVGTLVSASGTGEEGAQVEVFVGNVSVGTVTVPAGGMWGVSFAQPATDGDYTVRAESTDPSLSLIHI